MYLGLVNRSGDEMSDAGYHRLDMSNITFKLSPSKPEDEACEFTFVNTSYVEWGPFQHTWPRTMLYLAVYREVDDEKPVLVRSLKSGPYRLVQGDMMAIFPGSLTIPTEITEKLKWVDAE